MDTLESSLIAEAAYSTVDLSVDDLVDSARLDAAIQRWALGSNEYPRELVRCLLHASIGGWSS